MRVAIPFGTSSTSIFWPRSGSSNSPGARAILNRTFRCDAQRPAVPFRRLGHGPVMESSWGRSKVDARGPIDKGGPRGGPLASRRSQLFNPGGGCKKNARPGQSPALRSVASLVRKMSSGTRPKLVQAFNSSESCGRSPLRSVRQAIASGSAVGQYAQVRPVVVFIHQPEREGRGLPAVQPARISHEVVNVRRSIKRMLCVPMWSMENT